MRRPAFLVLLAAAALFFGWEAYHAWTAPEESVAAAPPGSAALPAGAIAPADVPDAENLSAAAATILARPLFRPDRQPYREDAVSAAPTRNYEAELARYTLLGVLLLGKDTKAVVVGKGGAGREERWELAPGDALGGFIVKDIRAEGVSLAADDREFLLPLYAGGPKGTGPSRTEVGGSKPGGTPQPAGSPGGTVRGAPAAPPAVTPAPAPPAPTGATMPDNGRRQRPFIPRRR